VQIGAIEDRGREQNEGFEDQELPLFQAIDRRIMETIFNNDKDIWNTTRKVLITHMQNPSITL